MRSKRNILSLIILLFVTLSCIKNDIPYPTILGNITAFDVLGSESTTIDDQTKTVNIILSDTTNINKVYLTKFLVSNDAKISPEPSAILNLSSPVQYTLTTYQEYIWTISATQNVNRYFNVENQIGTSVFDIENHIIHFSVPESNGLSNIKVLAAKFGAAGSVISPNIFDITDFTNPVKVTLTYYESTQEWTIIGTLTEFTYSTKSVNAFAKYAIIEGEGEVSNNTYGFEYKLLGEASWTKVPKNEITYNSGLFNAIITGLQPQTDYIVRATEGENYANQIMFTTEVAAQVPNSDFNEWCKGTIDPVNSANSAKGKSWFPDINLDSENYWWDTGNIGANTIGTANNITTPEDNFVISGRAAKMSSKKIFGFFAAGSLYTGKYGKTTIPGATLYFGKEFTSRPKALKGYYSYSPGIVDIAKDEYKTMLNKNDTCSIYALLTSWSAPFEVNTNSGTFVDFNAPYVIAICELYDGVGTGPIYKEFTLDFKYKDYSTKPTYILLVASSSKYGDYFTGSTSSVLFTDQFELIY